VPSPATSWLGRFGRRHVKRTCPGGVAIERDLPTVRRSLHAATAKFERVATGTSSGLVRELAVYSPRRLRRSILIELEQCSQTDVLAMLAAVEVCLSANAIRSVGIELDGSKYMMAPSQVSR
jgi:hypothetical protein